MEEIGRRLRAAREAKGVSLQVVEDETKIRRKYVEALEAGRDTDLPGDAYLKGFLRTYGNYLGLDGTALVEEYKRHKDAQAPREPGEAKPASQHGQVPPAVPVQERPRPAEKARPRVEELAAGPERQRPAPRRQAPAADSGALRLVGLSLVVLLLIGAVAYLGWQIFRPSAKPLDDPAPATPPVATNPQPEPTPPVKLPDPPKVTMTRGTGEDVIFTVPGQALEVRVEPGVNRVWTQAVIDGAAPVEATLTTPKDFKATQSLRIRFGHMNDVSIVVNGQRFEKPLQNGPYNLIFNKQQ